jgi:hypothetical protein
MPKKGKKKLTMTKKSITRKKNAKQKSISQRSASESSLADTESSNAAVSSHGAEPFKVPDTPSKLSSASGSVASSGSLGGRVHGARTRSQSRSTAALPTQTGSIDIDEWAKRSSQVLEGYFLCVHIFKLEGFV